MAGETDLSKLIRDMAPELNAGEYVFCSTDSSEGLDPLGTFREREGWTAILTRQQADEAGLSYSTAFAWITLTVHSDLEAVGLTAAVSHALANAGIPCNVVAALHHDHLFVPVKNAARAMEILKGLG